MIVLRITGRLFIVLALITFAAGLVIWLFGADVTELAGKAWFDADAASLNFAQVIVQRYLFAPSLWDAVIVPHLLARPLGEAIIIVFVLFLVLGALLVRLGQRRRRRRRSSFG